MKRQRNSDNGDESSCCQPLCFSPPLCLQHCNTNSWRKKKRKRTKKKKSCSVLPFLPVQIQLHAAKSLHYLRKRHAPVFIIQRHKESRPAKMLSVFSCAEHLINLPYKCFTFAKSRENDFLAGQPFIQQNAYVLFVRYISRTCDSVISLKFW